MHFDACFETSSAAVLAMNALIDSFSNVLGPNLTRSGNQKEWSGQHKLA